MSKKWAWSSTVALSLTCGAWGLEAATLHVGVGGDLQAALDAAQPGDTILLQEGVEFVGNFVLPVKTGVGWITLRTSAPDTVLPAAGVRIRPADAPRLASLRSPNTSPALRTAPGTHHWVIRYLEFRANQSGGGDIVQIGDGSSLQNALALVPQHIALDHVYVHGDPVRGQKRGIALNAAHVTITDSYVSDCKGIAQDTQAIAGWNGPGPYTIENNYLEAAGENVLFGGADPAILNLVPDGITFRRNHVTRPMSWRNPIVGTPQGLTATSEPGGALNAGVYAYRVVARHPVNGSNIARSTASGEVTVSTSAGGQAVRVRWKPVPYATDYRVYGRTTGAQATYWTVTTPEFLDTGQAGTAEAVPTSSGTVWTVKNLFELKNARNVVIEDNIFENHWKQSQPGWAIVLTPRNSGGTCTWCVVERVRFEWNLVRNVSAGVNVLGFDSPSSPTRQTNDLAFRHNLFTGMATALGGNAWFLQLGGEPRDIAVEHNTIDANGSTLVYVYSGTSTDPKEVYGFRMIANAARHGTYGMNGTYFSYGNGILDNYYPDAVFLANYLAGGSASRYPVGTLVAGTFTEHFVGAANGDFSLVSGSFLRNAAPDGSDIGVDHAALVTRIAGVEAGIAPGGDPPPPPPAPPIASFTLNCTHLVCAFADTSTPGANAIAQRVWSFGDGSTSTAASGTHTFTTAGTYNVVLTVTDSNNMSDSESKTVTILAAPAAENVLPTAAFEYACVDLTCTFTDRSADADGTVTSWAWRFDTAGTSAGASPSFSFPSPGAYDVSLTVVDNAGGTSTTTKAVNVSAGIHAAFLAAAATSGGNPRSPSNWKAHVTIGIHGSNEAAIAGATINATWSGAWTKVVSCVTSSTGQCSFQTGGLSMQSSAVTLTLTRVSAPSGVYQPSANHSAVGSGGGTSITVNRP